MDWTKDKPTKVGFYWIYRPNTSVRLDSTRVIKVWQYSEKWRKEHPINDEFDTSEDGGAPLNDEIYEGCWFYGPITPPEF